jgi:hypothetical protein
MKSIWVLEALRYGEREMHSYVVGVFSSEAVALVAAEAEEVWRGGKYECVVSEHKLDGISQEKLDYKAKCF